MLIKTKGFIFYALYVSVNAIFIQDLCLSGETIQIFS